MHGEGVVWCEQRGPVDARVISGALGGFWERDGVVLHTYALWRQADWGPGSTSEREGIQRVAFNALRDRDDDNEKACEEGGF